MPTDIPHFVNGAPVGGRSGRTAPVFIPATGEQTGTVALASRAEVDEAVAAAKRAFPRARIRQRHRDLHPRRGRGAQVRASDPGRHG